MFNKKISDFKFQISDFKKMVFVVFFLIFGISSNAQCAMCRAALESEGNTAKAQGVNDGIVYLMVIPYILMAAVGYYVYRMKTKNKAK
jgi:hypothetical protein